MVVAYVRPDALGDGGGDVGGAHASLARVRVVEADDGHTLPTAVAGKRVSTAKLYINLSVSAIKRYARNVYGRQNAYMR